MEELFQTYGIDLKKIIADAKANGNAEFGELVEKQVANVQICYDIIAQKYSATGAEDPWKIDAQYVRTLLK